MSIKDIIAKFFGGFPEYIDTEKELLKLRIIKELSGVLGIVFGAVFLIMLFHIGIALIALWLGFMLSSLLDSYAIGFGTIGALYLIFLTILIIYRKSMLIKPFTNFVISALTENETKDKDKNEPPTT